MKKSVFTTKFSLFRFGFFLSALLFESCTGASLLTSYGIKGNTHPVKDYGKVDVYMKGGLIYHGNSIPGQVASGDFEGEKKMGRACSHSYLYLIALGDSSIQEACRKSQITQVISIQHDITALLGGFLYHRHCTLVVGDSDDSWTDPRMSFKKN